MADFNFKLTRSSTPAQVRHGGDRAARVPQGVTRLRPHMPLVPLVSAGPPEDLFARTFELLGDEGPALALAKLAHLLKIGPEALQALARVRDVITGLCALDEQALAINAETGMLRSPPPERLLHALVTHGFAELAGQLVGRCPAARTLQFACDLLSSPALLHGLPPTAVQRCITRGLERAKRLAAPPELVAQLQKLQAAWYEQPLPGCSVQPGSITYEGPDGQFPLQGLLDHLDMRSEDAAAAEMILPCVPGVFDIAARLGCEPSADQRVQAGAILRRLCVNAATADPALVNRILGWAKLNQLLPPELDWMELAHVDDSRLAVARELLGAGPQVFKFAALAQLLEASREQMRLLAKDDRLMQCLAHLDRSALEIKRNGYLRRPPPLALVFSLADMGLPKQAAQLIGRCARRHVLQFACDLLANPAALHALPRAAVQQCIDRAYEQARRRRAAAPPELVARLPKLVSAWHAVQPAPHCRLDWGKLVYTGEPEAFPLQDLLDHLDARSQASVPAELAFNLLKSTFEMAATLLPSWQPTEAQQGMAAAILKRLCHAAGYADVELVNAMRDWAAKNRVPLVVDWTEIAKANVEQIETHIDALALGKEATLLSPRFTGRSDASSAYHQAWLPIIEARIAAAATAEEQARLRGPRWRAQFENLSPRVEDWLRQRPEGPLDLGAVEAFLAKEAISAEVFLAVALAQGRRHDVGQLYAWALLLGLHHSPSLKFPADAAQQARQWFVRLTQAEAFSGPFVMPLSVSEAQRSGKRSVVDVVRALIAGLDPAAAAHLVIALVADEQRSVTGSAEAFLVNSTYVDAAAAMLQPHLEGQPFETLLAVDLAFAEHHRRPNDFKWRSTIEELGWICPVTQAMALQLKAQADAAGADRPRARRALAMLLWGRMARLLDDSRRATDTQWKAAREAFEALYKVAKSLLEGADRAAFKAWARGGGLLPSPWWKF